MKNFSTWLLAIFMVMFLTLRVMVAFQGAYGRDFAGITPLNQQMEVALLFIALICVIFVVKRKMFGAIIYFMAYGIYFGVDFITMLTNILQSGFSITYGVPGIVSMIGFILPIAVIFDMAADKARKISPTNKKTDWFYKGEKYDRDDLDSRRDKNNYRLS